MIGGLHPAPAPFQFLPNPDLKPEVAENLEAGLTGQFNGVLAAEDMLSVRAGIFKNNVDDYIGAQYLTNGTPANLADDTYQYVNIAKAELWGIEGEASYDAGFMFASVAASMIRGKDKTADDWLLTAPADKVVSTLGARFLDQKATFGARWFAVAAQDRVPAGGIAADAYNLVNLFASYQINENIKLALNAENIFNEDYRRYLDGTDSPGRSVMFTVETRLGQ